MPDDYSIIKNELKERVMNSIDLKRDLEDSEILDIIDEIIIAESRREYLSIAIRGKLKKDIFNSLRRLDILQELVEDNHITEIMINGPDSIFVEKDGVLHSFPGSFESLNKLEDIIQQIVSKANRIVNEANPIVDARLMDGSRVNVVLPPVALNGPVVTIRKFPKDPITMDQLILKNSITAEIADFLRTLVVAKYNIFVSGGTGSGKTTFLNALSEFIPKDERIITIEDSAELQLQGLANLVRLEVRNANVEGKNRITIRDLIKAALRMRPNRIIVGEIRDGAAIDLLSAYNTGHDGSLSTGHANSPMDMLARLETLVLFAADLPLLAVRKQIASAIDIIIHLGRLRDKSRRVLDISEVLGISDGEIILNPLFIFHEEKVESGGRIDGRLIRTNNEFIHVEKLRREGL